MKFLGKPYMQLALFSTLVLFSLLASSTSAALAAKGPPHKTRKLEKGVVTLAKGHTRPLVQPRNAPKLVTVAAPQTNDPVDLRVLVISADGTEANLPAIRQALDYLGTPYNVYIALQTPGGLTPDMLFNGDHGFYEGIILTTGNLSYYNGSTWLSALTQQEWQNLWTYEATFKIRQVSWYTYPTADFGFQPPTAGIDTTTNPLSIRYTANGASLFPYANTANPLTIQYAWTYLAQPLSDGQTTSLLTDAQGNALVALRTYPDGRQNLALTFDSNPNLLHSVVLSYGVINWVTNGLFLGARHTYLAAQVDDLFLDNDIWRPTTPCGTPVEQTGAIYRITGSDFQTVVNWQQSKRVQPTTQGLTLSLAFNGVGTTGIYSPDTLTPLAGNVQGQFYWLNHTYDHLNLDAVDYATATQQIQQNNTVAATTLRLTHYSTANMVTPDVSGLTNAQFLQAAHDSGIRYLVSDTSLPGYNNPSPNAGIYNSLQPSILMIPRRPTNLFYNVSTPQEWGAEYNCLYASFWGRNLTYQEILDQESQVILFYLLRGDLDPLMFHQANLRAYSGNRTLLGDLLDLTFQKYNRLFTLPITSLTMDSLGQQMAARMQYNTAGATASIVPGQTITLTAQRAATIPVTGLRSPDAEFFGGQYISYITLSAGQSVTLPLQ